MFRKNDIKRAIGAESAITDEMLKKISQWLEMYRGNAPWTNDEYVKSLRLEQGICREFADVVLSELEISITNDKLNEVVSKHIAALNENMQSGLALGSFCLKPLGDDKAEFVTADKFIPLKFDDDGNLTGVVFVSTRQVKSDSFYRRFELHELTGNGLRIKNMAFHSSSANEIGAPCELAEVDEWAELIPEVIYPVDRVDFGYYRNPIKNEIDGSFCGVSIYESAQEIIEKADIQFSRLDWEFESGERVINVDITALQEAPAFGTDGKKRYKMPKLNKRLYRGLNLDGGNGDFYKEFSPEFRDSNIINGLEQIKRAIEFNVGLAYGDLSDVQSVEKTATEIKHAKQRKYARVNAIEKNLQKCLEDFTFGVAFYNGLTKSGYEFNCKWNDSILTDEDTERKQDIQDISIGALPLWQYRMKWYGEDEKTAKAIIAGMQSEVIE
ncbi:MAG: hypothetical protein ACI4JX_00010 [Oscillospiraceae bacterium]